MVPSWEEHLRQHRHRLTGTDQNIEREAMDLAARPLEVVHLLPARQGGAANQTSWSTRSIRS
jgi:hypothetical protein